MIVWEINMLHFQTFSITYLPLKTSRYFFFGYELVGMFWDLAETFADFAVWIRKNLDSGVWFQCRSVGSLADATNTMHTSLWWDTELVEQVAGFWRLSYLFT